MLKTSSRVVVFTLNQLYKLKKNAVGQKVVLVGGCFDVLHPGHLIFLERAKKEGDLLVVLLESDEKIRVLKGEKRPIHTQADRAKVLSDIKFVNFVILLSYLKKESDYDEVVKKISPTVIAVTKGVDDSHHKRVAKLSGATLKYVTKIVGDYSTTKIITHSKDL